MPEEIKPNDQGTMQTITTTPEELHQAVGQAVQAATTELAVQVAEVAQDVKDVKGQLAEASAGAPIEATPETPKAPTEETAVQVAVAVQAIETATTALTDQVTELASHVQAVAEAAKTTPADEPPAETAAQTAEAIQAEIKTAIVDEVKMQVATQTPAASNGTTVKHLASVTKISSIAFVFLTIILSIGMTSFGILYMLERSQNNRLSAEMAEAQAQASAAMRELAQDLISIHLVKNFYMEAAIEDKIEGLYKEGLPEVKVIPMAYTDNAVIEEITDNLPESAKKLPYAEDLVKMELKRVANFAEREIPNRQKTDQ